MNGTALPVGVYATSTENNPTGEGSGIVVVSGVTAVSAINNPTAAVGETAIPTGTTALSTKNNPVGLAFAAAAGVGCTSSFTDPTIPAIRIATIPNMVNKVFAFGGNQARATVSSTALTPWTVESSAPWLIATKVNEQYVNLSVSENNLPTTGWQGRPNQGTYTGHLRFVAGINTLNVPVVHNVGWGDSLDGSYVFADYPF
jgi:hypothetical protein